MGLWTNAGLTLVATAVQSNSASKTAISYVSISPGCGTLNTAITATTVYTTLALDAPLVVALSSGQTLTVTDGSNSETVVTSGIASIGATSIPINSWTAAHSYLAHTTGVCPTPLATDITLYNETARVVANAGAAGASAGESLNGGYFDGTQATAVYLLVGYWGGSSATSTLATGTLMGEDIQYWNHTLNNDSNMYQADSQI